MIELNKKELKLLYYLELNCRDSIKNLSRLSGLSKNSVILKIDEFAKQGIIKGFTTSLDYFKLDFSAYRIEFFCYNIEKEKYEQLINFIDLNPSTHIVEKLDQNYGISMVILTRKHSELNNFLSRLQKRFGKYIYNSSVLEINHREAYPSAYLLDKAFDDSGLFFSTSEKSQEKIVLDDIDIKILRIMIENARIPIIDLASKVGIPERTAKYRLLRLEKQKIILRYRASINKSLIGYKRVRIRFECSAPFPEVVDYLRKNPIVTKFEEVNILDYWFFGEFESNESITSFLESLKEKFGPLKSYSYLYIPESNDTNNYLNQL